MHYHAAMLKLHRLKIEKLRRVKPCELYFNDGLNVLLGRNGTGKTTLLKLITALYSSPIGEILPGEEYELEVEFRFLVGSVTTRIKSMLAKASPLSIAVGGISSDSNNFELEINFHVSPEIWLKAKYPHPEYPNMWLISRSSGESFLGFDYSKSTIVGLFQLFLDGDHWPENAESARNELANTLRNFKQPFRFDESLEALATINKYKIGVTTIRDGGFSIGLLEGVLPDEFWSLFVERLQKDLKAPTVILEDASLNFLKKFVELTGLQSAYMQCERTEKNVLFNRMFPPGLSQSSRNIFSNFRFSFVRRDGSEFWQDQLSYGQKRLLVFLYYVSAVPHVLIADELVNGLHHEWIEYCVKAMQGKQAFLTSQNPLLLDHLWFESQEEVRKTFLLCSTTPPSGDEMQWKNMNESEAEVFYKGYQVGIQHVSEILHSEGLW